MNILHTDQANDWRTLETIQAIALDLAKQFARICEEYELTYSLFLGSLLGAVRHQGFIPWDDDVDFAMPREDFLCFAAIADEVLPPNIALRCFQRGNSKRLVARIENTDTLIRLDSYRRDNELPVWLDIFVLDGEFGSLAKRKMHNTRVLVNKGLWAISAFDEVVNLNRPGRPVYQQAIINACRIVNPGKVLNTSKRLKKLDRVIGEVPFDEAEMVYCAATAYPFNRAIWHRSDFEDLTAFAFEDTTFMGPKNYHRVLRTTYGDYMTLPPIESRTIHQIKVIKSGGF